LTRFFDVDKPYNINFLWRSDTLCIKRVLHGYITAKQRNIDCDALPAKTLTEMLEQLGADK
jgi:hypothetical protein